MRDRTPTTDYYEARSRRHGPAHKRPSSSLTDFAAQRAQRGNRAALRDLTEETIVPIAHAISGKAERTLPRGRGLTRDDLMQEATAAVLAALPRWERGRASFQTFAYNHARYATLNVINEGTLMTVGRGSMSKFGKMLADGAPPPPGYAMSRDTWDALKTAVFGERSTDASYESLESGGRYRDDRTLGDSLVDPEDAYEEVMDSVTLAYAFDRAAKHLKEPERRALVRRFGLDGGGGATWAVIGEEEGVSAERARQRTRSGLNRLRLAVGEEEDRTRYQHDYNRRRAHLRREGSPEAESA